MSEFMLWFWRPIAETLGVIALLAAIGICVGLWCAAPSLWRRLTGGKK